MRLFGPVFLFNLFRVTRQRRFFAARIAYGFTLFGLLVFFAWEYLPEIIAALANRNGNTLHLLENLGQLFFLYVQGLQFYTVVLLTPGNMATALSEEKLNRQLELLLTTDVGVGEIVLGKMLPRLGLVFQLVLVGLPVLSLMQFFGGVQPSLIWIGYGITLVTLFSLGSVSVLCSLYSESTPGAVMKSYLVPLLFFALLWALPYGHKMVEFFGDDPAWHHGLDVIVSELQRGNPLNVVKELRHHLQVTGSLGNKPQDLFADYAVFHGLIIFFSLVWTILRLRRVYLHYVARDQSPARRSTRRFLLWRRPRLGERPMLWKECFFAAASRLGPLWRAVSILGALAVTFIGFIVGAEVLAGSDPAAARQTLNDYLRIVGPVLLGLTLLQTGVSAAGCLQGEKQRLTWDSLVMTLISLRGILAGKWWGSIYLSRYLLGVLGLLLILGMVTGALHPIAALLLAGVTCMACSFTASLGVFFAVRCRTHFRAVFCTLLVLIIMNLGLPYLSPKVWAFQFNGVSYYPAPPGEYDLWRFRDTPVGDTYYRETGLALGLKTFSPVNLWQWLALTWEQVSNAEALERRYEWEESRAEFRMNLYNRTIFGSLWEFSPRKSLPVRLSALLFVLLFWFVLDYFLWRRGVRRLMLQMERVDEYPIRYWRWPPGA